MGVAQGKDMVVAERIAGGRRRGVDEDGAQGEGNAELRRLVVELSNKWRSLTGYKRIRSLPATNNCTEQVIGRSKACA